METTIKIGVSQQIYKKMKVVQKVNHQQIQSNLIQMIW